MFRLGGALVTALAITTSSMAESKSRLPTFEVASVKMIERPSGPFRVEINAAHGRFVGSHVTITNLIQRAMNLDGSRIIAPAWSNRQMYDISATMPEHTADDRLRLMLEKLLRERFNLQFHWEARLVPCLELSLGSGSSKLNPAPEGPFSERVGPGSIIVKQATIALFASLLRGPLGHEVADKTGASGKYNISLIWAPADADPDDPRPDIYGALRDLGFRLRPSRMTVTELIVDQLNQKPTPN